LGYKVRPKIDTEIFRLQDRLGDTWALFDSLEDGSAYIVDLNNRPVNCV